MGPDPSKSLAALMRHSLDKTNKGGMADNVPAVVDGQQPAALSTNEYVIPADVVALIGDGSSEAGGEILDHLVAQIRQMKTGSKKQPKPMKELLGNLFNPKRK